MKKIIYLSTVILIIFSLSSSAFADGYKENCPECNGYQTVYSKCCGDIVFYNTSTHQYGFLWLDTCYIDNYDSIGDPCDIEMICMELGCDYHYNFSEDQHYEYQHHNDCGKSDENWCPCVFTGH